MSSLHAEQRSQRLVDGGDVAGLTRESGPAKRADAPAEERPDIGRDEARVCECVFYACLIGLSTQVVAVVENIAAPTN